ncbi:unnamed protein product [Moneuplotes crassus]|uniref:Uncharacterized protein n=1 Tax=Euplotes crassus TaxID=5936 RepID=A0AAD1U099_EUPCR|nr:unnamed protein product [Moneuplotes crassus]
MDQKLDELAQKLDLESIKDKTLMQTILSNFDKAKSQLSSLQELEDSNSKKLSHFESSQKRMEKLLNQVENLKLEKASLKDWNRNLQEEVEELTEIIEDLRKQSQELQDTNSEILHENDHLGKQASSFRGKYESLKEEIVRIKQQNESHVLKNMGLQDELNSAKVLENSQSSQYCLNSKEECSSRLKNLEDENKALKREKESSEATISFLNAEDTKKDKIIQDLKSEQASQKSQYQVSKVKMLEITEANDKLNHTITQLKNQATAQEEKVKKIQAKNLAHLSKLDQLDVAKKAYEEKLKKLEEKTSKLEERNSKQIAKFREIKQELEKEREAVKGVMEQIEGVGIGFEQEDGLEKVVDAVKRLKNENLEVKKSLEQKEVEIKKVSAELQESFDHTLHTFQAEATSKANDLATEKEAQIQTLKEENRVLSEVCKKKVTVLKKIAEEVYKQKMTMVQEFVKEKATEGLLEFEDPDFEGSEEEKKECMERDVLRQIEGNKHFISKSSSKVQISYLEAPMAIQKKTESPHKIQKCKSDSSVVIENHKMPYSGQENESENVSKM